MPREPLRRSQRPVDLWTTAKALAHRAHRTNNKNRSGQLMCYQNRTTLCATDSKNIHTVKVFPATFSGIN